MTEVLLSGTSGSHGGAFENPPHDLLPVRLMTHKAHVTPVRCLRRLEGCRPVPLPLGWDWPLLLSGQAAAPLAGFGVWLEIGCAEASHSLVEMTGVGQGAPA